MRTVLFTGAGASNAFGYPLTRELLPNVRDDLGNGNLFKGTLGRKSARSKRNKLRSYLVKLLPGFKRAKRKNLPLITDVFSIVEYSIANDESLAIGGENKLRECRDLLKHAIADVFIRLFFDDYNKRKKRERDQERLLGQLTGWMRGRKGGLALVSTNYDISIEYALWEKQAFDSDKVDLGFDWRQPEDPGAIFSRPRNPDFGVYKLHGSFNQLRCRTCGYVYFNSHGSIAHQPFREEKDFNNTCHCGDRERIELNIVSPSLVRDVRDANLLSVWRSALECMRNAERWVIVGYALPPEDFAIRSLLLRAYMARKKKPDITVVQHGDAAKPAYRMLFPKCKYRSDGLKGFLSHT